MDNNYAIVDNFLSLSLANKLWLMMLNERDFKPSTTASNNKSWRQSMILKNSEEVRSLFLPELYKISPNWLSGFQRETGKTLDSYTRAELQVTRTGDGGFYRWHCDTGTANTNHRRLTFVYYLHSIPKAFIGGELRIYDQIGFRRPSSNCYYRDITPLHNRLVLFHPDRLHEIRTTHLPHDRWSEGRFTINGWLGDAE